MIAEGRKGSIELTEAHAIIRPLGTFGRKRPEQSVRLESIKKIHFKPAGAMLGYIFLETGDSNFSMPSFEASNRRSGLQFSAEQQPAFEQVRNQIEGR